MALLLLAGGALAAERCIAVDGDTLVCQQRTYGHDRYGRVLAEAFVNARRIEQADVGPRAGRGWQRRGDRHLLRL